jgi:hypothetical protein
MAEALIKTYIDPYGNEKQGYIINNRTYTDPYGVNRVEVGSQIQADDGTWYKLTENGGVITSGYQYPASQSGSPGQTPTYTPGGYYEPPTLPSANSAEQYIKELYAAQQEAILQAYKTAYDANVNTLDAAAAKIPAQYQAARNRAAAQSEIQKANFNEYAAASGLNSGAGGQAMLAMSNHCRATCRASVWRRRMRWPTWSSSARRLQRSTRTISRRPSPTQAGGGHATTANSSASTPRSATHRHRAGAAEPLRLDKNNEQYNANRAKPCRRR